MNDYKLLFSNVILKFVSKIVGVKYYMQRTVVT